MTTPTHALVSDRLDLTGAPSWLFRKSRLGAVRVTATGTRAKPIFVGVARADRVNAYLRGSGFDRVADFGVDPLSVTLERRPGKNTPGAPTGEHFWTARASGAGTQSVTWPVKSGTWDIVVMNADGTAGITTDLTVGARAGFIIWVGVGLLLAGGLVLASAAAAIVIGVRTPGSPNPPSAEATGRAIGEPA